MIVVDTSILSLAFRRRTRMSEPPPVAMLRRMIEDDAPLAIPGIVLQEVLSGIRTSAQFASLQESLDGFPLLLATRQHHLRAAEIVTDCRANGISTSSIDALIAALALEHDAMLFTLDDDFSRIASVRDLRLVATE